MITKKEMEKYNVHGCGELAERCRIAEINQVVLLGEFAEFLKENCDIHVVNMVRPFLNKQGEQHEKNSAGS